jgi:hypothetical protein
MILTLSQHLMEAASLLKQPRFIKALKKPLPGFQVLDFTIAEQNPFAHSPLLSVVVRSGAGKQTMLTNT